MYYNADKIEINFPGLIRGAYSIWKIDSTSGKIMNVLTWNLKKYIEWIECHSKPEVDLECASGLGTWPLYRHRNGLDRVVLLLGIVGKLDFCLGETLLIQMNL